MTLPEELTRMTKLLELLGNPEKKLKAIHIAGTNGKGSTAYMISSILEKAGYTVGLYTSPHLEEYYERIQIWDGNHSMIPADKYEELELLVDMAADSIKELGELHTFEKITAIAYLYFAERLPDYVVLECGLGGRLDSTNTIEKPLVSVITQIGLDHTEQLGKTIFKVAREKAGIIKPNVPVVSHVKDMSLQQIIAKVASENNSECVDASQYRSKFKKYKLAMMGMHQVDNAATAVMAIKTAGIEVSEDNIVDGLATAINPGRFEMIGENPCWILDGAHNPDAMKAALETFKFVRKNKKFEKTLVIFGCMRDKNYVRMIQLIHEYTRGADIATVDIGDSRAEDSVVLGKRFANIGHERVCYESVQEAYDEVKSMDYDNVLVIGSIYLIGAMRKILFKEGN